MMNKYKKSSVVLSLALFGVFLFHTCCYAAGLELPASSSLAAQANPEPEHGCCDTTSKSSSPAKQPVCDCYKMLAPMRGENGFVNAITQNYPITFSYIVDSIFPEANIC